MMSSEMHLLMSYFKAMGRMWCKVDISPVSDLATTGGTKTIYLYLPDQPHPFPPFSPDLPLFNSQQNIFVILILIVKIILILNNPMLSRPEFWLKPPGIL